ncbi:MAG: hypothetical protein R2939_18480 [Kofleriaceae bacterium]
MSLAVGGLWAGCGDDDAGKADPMVTVSSLEFGETECGDTAIPREFQITNAGLGALSFTTELAGGADSPYLVVPPAGVVLPGQQLSVTVYSSAIPYVSETTPNLYGDTLTVTTDVEGDAPHEIELTQSATGVCDGSGGGLDGPAFPAVSTTTVAFGQTACGGTAVPRQFQITNSGGEAYSFTSALGLGAASPYLVVPDAGTVLPGQQISVTVYSTAIPATSAITPNLYGDTLTITTNVTGAAPLVVNLTQGASGAILEWSMASVDVAGDQPVGSSTATAVTLNNVGNAPVEVSFTSTEDVGFSVTTATIAGGGSLAGDALFTPTRTGLNEGSVTVTATGACSAPPALPISGTATLIGAAVDVAWGHPARIRNSQTAIGALHIILQGGLVASIGNDELGQLGTSSIGSLFSLGVGEVVRKADGTALRDIVRVASGRARACGLDTRGDLWCWGNVLQASLRRGGPTSQPFASLAASNVADFDLNYVAMCAISTGDGALSCTRAEQQNAPQINYGGLLATGATSIRLNPNGGAVLLDDGTVATFGLSGNHLGTGNGSNEPPGVVPGLTEVVSIASSGGTPRGTNGAANCALRMDGTVWCWGRTGRGQLGIGNNNPTSTPTQVLLDTTPTPLTGVTALTGEHHHFCALLDTSEVYCWGEGRYGARGDDNTTDSNVATKVQLAVDDAVAVGLSRFGGCAVHADGGLSCWGVMPETLSSELPQRLPRFSPVL